MSIKSDVYIAIDRNKTLSEEPSTGHNRWHPDIPAIVKVDPGQVVGLETRDAFDGQVNPRSTAADLLKTSLGVVHPLTGPVYVNGAEPGDLLAVKIVEVNRGRLGLPFRCPGSDFCVTSLPSLILSPGPSPMVLRRLQPCLECVFLVRPLWGSSVLRHLMNY